MTRACVFLALGALWPSSYAGGPTIGCDIPGEQIQWIADYCMAKLGTDDEIAASDCIAKENEKEFRSSCMAKGHFKHALCKVLVKSGSRSGSVEACANDPAFVGPTVQAGGGGAQQAVPADAPRPAGSGRR